MPKRSRSSYPSVIGSRPSPDATLIWRRNPSMHSMVVVLPAPFGQPCRKSRHLNVDATSATAITSILLAEATHPDNDITRLMHVSRSLSNSPHGPRSVASMRATRRFPPLRSDRAQGFYLRLYPSCLRGGSYPGLSPTPDSASCASAPRPHHWHRGSATAGDRWRCGRCGRTWTIRCHPHSRKPPRML